MRNKQLLTDRENERMFADIVESIVKKPIHIRYTTKPTSSVESFGSYHVITLGRTKGVDKFTLLNHEAGHILFNSPTKSGEYMISCWANEWKADVVADLNLIKETYWNALNMIEDQRIESLMAKLYLYNKKRFYKAKLHMGSEYRCMAYTPFLVLGYARFLRDDLIENDKCYDMAKKILNEVEGTGQRGALIGLAKFKPFIDKYIYSKINHGDNSLGYDVDNEDWEEEVDHTPLKYDEVGMVSTLTYGYSVSLLDKLFEDSRKDGEREIGYIKEVLSNMNEINPHNIIEGGGEEYGDVGIPIQEIAGGMNKIFKKMNEMPKYVIGYEGDEIDIESYITNKAGYACDLDYCFKDTVYVHGASILVSVDGSSSMDNGNSMTRARNMVATMYKAIENVNNIDLRTIVWSADVSGRMNITNIGSMEDTKYIRTVSNYPTTPTHMAIEYSTKMMKRMKGRRKLLIFITDGQPEYMNQGTLIPTNTMIQMSRHAMAIGMKRCDSMVVLLIKPSDYSKKCCEDIFGNRLIVADDMKKGSDIIMNKFKHLVMGVLR
jgi:hypothetical protein